MEKHGVIEYRGYSLSVEYDYYPPSKGAREKGSGVQLEPDEDALVELTSVQLNGMDMYDLLIDQQQEIEDTIYEQLLPEDEPDGDY